MLDVFDRFVVEDSSDKDALSSDLILSILQSADVAMTHFDFFSDPVGDGKVVLI